MRRKLGRCCGSCRFWKKHGAWLEHWWFNVGTCSRYPIPFDLKANGVCTEHAEKAKRKDAA